ncbi:MAG TPA: hypothetical protein VMG82_24845 [Candidatus Sulfotelmatobacter sp.]|nr:hypothetical protein [Candidatus Sulfotelmatobacter sp.]
MATLAGVTLLWRGTMLDRIWSLNPRAYRQLATLGGKAGILMLVVAGTLSVAGIGWFYRRHWAWLLSVAIIATQIAGDLVNIYVGHVIEGAIGVGVAGALLFYLLRPPVRAAFGR